MIDTNCLLPGIVLLGWFQVDSVLLAVLGLPLELCQCDLFAFNNQLLGQFPRTL